MSITKHFSALAWRFVKIGEEADSSTCGYFLYGSGEDPLKARALDVVEQLLSRHRCITAIEFNHNWTLRPSLLQAVKRNRFLRSVTFCGTFDKPDYVAFIIEVTKYLWWLKNLAFKVSNFEKESFANVFTFNHSLHLHMNYLNTLDVADLMMPDIEARRLVWALIANKSINDLTVGKCVFFYHDEASNALFRRYLSKENSTLRKLTLKSQHCFDSRSFLSQLIDAICKINTLVELNADIIVVTNIFACTVALFGNLVTQSATLRSLRLPSTQCECRAKMCNPNLQLPDPKAAQYMEPWLTAMRKPRAPLSQLCIDLRTFGEAECHAFFNAVGDNDALKWVVVDSLPDIEWLHKVCATIQDRGLNDRVVIKGHYMHSNTNQLLKCPQVSCATIGGCHFMRLRYVNMQPFISALEVVGGCAHVTSLRVICDHFDRNVFSALATSIRGPSALSDVDISLRYSGRLRTQQELRDVQAELASALASNLKLVRVSVQGFALSDEDLSVLADGAGKSICLTEFTLTPTVACLMRTKFNEQERKVYGCSVRKYESCMGVSNEKNIALASILESTRRNASAVSAAAQFVLGEQDCVEGARDIELMHDHPRLLEMVMEGADVTKAKATNMISSALRRVHRCTLEEFMRMAGVVKERVVCIGHPGTRLADINHDCWLHILSFLKIGDVRLN
ncbi:hypothetical protein HPB49_024335 [Dermacentor silvarum]|uniref:Uncharacterized protein n=1 Tax=Dermacentor silvarum TaxID=543639 RepID=A0ACB8CTR2_DERSI|nr:hypothetical protein HPB49_024335 [Dermacentor silvarum]